MTDDWRKDAACVNDPRVFATEPGEVATAISALCQTGGPDGSPCPIWRLCHEWATGTFRPGQKVGFDGIAGGAWFVDGRPRTKRRVYTPAALLAAHLRWNTGHRDPRTQEMEAGYQAAAKRTQRARVA